MRHEPATVLDLLVTELFDYAGMFPPASRSFKDALKESGSLASSLKRPWMVSGDLVLDRAHSEHLLNEDLSSDGFTHPLKLCLLASGTPDENISTARRIISHSSQEGLGVRIVSIEAKCLPVEIAQVISKYGPLVRETQAVLAIEPDLSTPTWEDELRDAITALTQAKIKPALKCRLTGPTGITPERLALAIAATCDNGLPLKVTGGLHHPIVEKSHHNYPMGFLNVAASVMLRRALGADFGAIKIAELLTNEHPKSLSLRNELGFGDTRISLSETRQAKEIAPFSIGSCSLHEPDQDLSRLFGDV
jgi:hypothetical protein